MKNSTSYSVDSLFKGLRNLLASLPTEEEKLELIQTLAGARQFLEDMTSLIEAFPTIESTEELSQGMTRLDILVDRAANHAPLRKLIGLKSPQTRRIKNINPVEDIASRALRVEERLRNTDSSEIVGLLERSGEPVLVLIEVATHLGLRTRKKERKVELINRIEAHITNQRGYDILRGADPHADGNEALPAAVG